MDNLPTNNPFPENNAVEQTGATLNPTETVVQPAVPVAVTPSEPTTTLGSAPVTNAPIASPLQTPATTAPAPSFAAAAPSPMANTNTAPPPYGTPAPMSATPASPYGSPAPIGAAPAPSAPYGAPTIGGAPAPYGAPGFGMPAAPVKKSGGGAKIAAILLAILLFASIAFNVYQSGQISTRNSEILATQEKLNDVKKDVDNMENELEIYTKYACFIFDNDDEYYHTYDCPDFTSEVEFLIYDILWAEYNEYEPHPDCH